MARPVAVRARNWPIAAMTSTPTTAASSGNTPMVSPSPSRMLAVPSAPTSSRRLSAEKASSSAFCSTIASPTPISAAATVITKIAMT